MKKELQQLKDELQKSLKDVGDLLGLEELENTFFSRKAGKFTLLSKGVKDLAAEERKAFGKLINQVRSDLLGLLGEKKEELEQEKMGNLVEEEKIDVTQPKLPKKELGHLHPITQAFWRMEEVARSMGFLIEDGPELESDHYVFGALNFPPNHPAREGMDTFYIKDNKNFCMRPHVSNMQVRLMRKYNEGGTKAVRLAYPGRVFRNEAVDASHGHTFYQYESLVVDRNINIGHLIAIIRELLVGLFGKEVEVRLRPGYFPFVEPGFEMDITCFLCDGKGCRVCKDLGWVEMLGCGLIHPNVIKEAGYNPKEWNGLAFGMGFDRLVMLKYGIEDIRHIHSGDLRFLKQF